MKKAQQTRLIDPAPGGIADDPSRIHFEMSAGKEIDKNRWALATFILLIIVALLVGAVYRMLPLKTVETYMVAKAEGGRLIVDENPVGNWAPDNDTVAYYLGQWVRNLVEINPSTIRDTMEASNRIVINAAVSQMKEFRNRENPLLIIRQYPRFSREYKFISINFIKPDVALIRYKTITRNGSDVPKEAFFANSITFVRIKPTAREQVMENPAGIFITYFDVSEEAVSK